MKIRRKKEARLKGRVFLLQGLGDHKLTRVMRKIRFAQLFLCRLLVEQLFLGEPQMNADIRFAQLFLCRLLVEQLFLGEPQMNADERGRPVCRGPIRGL
ncbi:MAG: hypothetical protein DRI57_16870 [Deltaproteobacteria bacterium]|nr:MAG: hypothetical protein DRI57_16870 [Deltaproteobacteria bacterium]